jgi:hypothetical protein
MRIISNSELLTVSGGSNELDTVIVIGKYNTGLSPGQWDSLKFMVEVTSGMGNRVPLPPPVKVGMTVTDVTFQVLDAAKKEVPRPPPGMSLEEWDRRDRYPWGGLRY